MRIISTLFFIIGVMLAEWACAGQAMTLEQCLKTGLENNPSFKASQYKLDSVGQDVKAARADFLPTLSSSFSASRIGSISSSGPTQTDFINQDLHSFNVKLTQILYAGSRLVNSYQKAKILEQASQAELNLARLELTYRIETTFYNLIKSKQDVITAAEAVTRLSESVKVAEAYFNKELVPEVDVLKARVDLADAENQFLIAKNNENRQRVTLFSLMDLPSDPGMDFADEEKTRPAERPSFESSLQYALENRPDIKNLEYQFQAAGKQSDIALGKYLPVVRFDVGYFDQTTNFAIQDQTVFGPTDRDQTNKYWSTGVTVSWDLFDGGRAWYEKEKYSIEATKIKALIKDAQNTIATGIRKALYSMAEADQRIASSTGALVAAKQNYISEENRLKAGISTIATLLDAQSRLVRAQTNKSNAILDYQLAQSELRLINGGQNN